MAWKNTCNKNGNGVKYSSINEKSYGDVEISIDGINNPIIKVIRVIDKINII